MITPLEKDASIAYYLKTKLDLWNWFDRDICKKEVKMNLYGWIMMMLYWTFVIGLVVFSFYKLLTTKHHFEEEKPKRRKRRI